MRNSVLALDQPWVLFYRDRLPVAEIAIRLGCTPQDLLPELTAPLTDALVSYHKATDGVTRRA